jgi:hypothetical protein
MSIEQRDVIDFVARTTDGDALLVAVEGREWDGSVEQLYELQEKVNRYVSFALEGEMVERYPHFAGRSVTIELRAVSAPDPATASFLDKIHDALELEGISFVVRRIGQVPLG